MCGRIELEMPIVSPGMVFYATLVVVVGVMPDQYCTARYRRLCRNKGRHVGCQFPNPGPGVSCQNYAHVKMSDDLKHFITHYINRRRQRVAAGMERVRGGLHLPKPAVMMLVEWDQEMALLAQRLADQCKFVHDECRATVRYPYAGQSVGEVRWRRSSSSDSVTAQRAIKRVFDAWWGEKRRVKPQQLTDPFRITSKGSMWGHFSQLTVWSLRGVGCAAVLHGRSNPRLLLVCDFSHTNMLGQRTISPGAMAPCPAQTARKMSSSYPLLCAPVRYKESSDAYELATEDDISYDNEDSSSTTTQSAFVHFHNEPFKDFAKRTWNSSNASLVTFEGHIENYNWPYDEVFRRTSTTNQYYKIDRGIGKVMSKDQLYGRQDRISQSWRFAHDIEVAFSTKKPSALIADPDENTEGEVDYEMLTTNAPQQSLKARCKWHQTRDRPKRPGANALLHISFSLRTSNRPPVSLMLDKDDIAQLFQDTGYNPGWNKRPAS